jgi:nitrate/nitrite transport system ATP-binding protein
MMSKPYLSLEQIDMVFSRGGTITQVLQQVSLTVEKGDFISIIGHSGCGKSTLLNIVAGLTETTRGVVFLEGAVVDAPGPDRAVVFQNHSLLPWLTVYENVKLAVDKVFSATKSRAERHEWTMRNLELVQMVHAKDKHPSEVSGGMKQRVGIARALAMEPTHDVDEAVLLSDRIVMMTNGPSARIGEILHVPLIRPRQRIELASDTTYIRCRSAVLKFLYERHRLVEAA